MNGDFTEEMNGLLEQAVAEPGVILDRRPPRRTKWNEDEDGPYEGYVISQAIGGEGAWKGDLLGMFVRDVKRLKPLVRTRVA